MTEKIIRKIFRQQKSEANKKKIRKIRNAALNKLDADKISTKTKKTIASASDRVEDLIDNTTLEDIDRGVGKAVGSAVVKAKKVGKAIDVTRDRIARSGRWIGKNKGKAALIAAAAGGAAYAMSEEDDRIKKIKAKDPSKRTAAERRLLQLMEE